MLTVGNVAVLFPNFVEILGGIMSFELLQTLCKTPGIPGREHDFQIGRAHV